MKKMIVMAAALMISASIMAQEVQPQSQPQEVAQPAVEKKEEKKVETKWTDSIELKGDFRLRYQMQMQDKNDEESKDRDRARYRLRFGAGAKVNEMTKVHFGLASGEAKITANEKGESVVEQDATSTNQTMTDGFTHKPIWIDYAYAEVTPLKGISLLGGKMKNPIFAPSDLLWDTDVTPEGIAAAVNYGINDMITILFNSGATILVENDKVGDTLKKNDPLMLFVQGGAGIKAGMIDAKIAAAYYNFARLNYIGMAPDFDSIALSADITAGIGSFMAGLFGEYVMNISGLEAYGDEKDQNSGMLIGVKGGSKKVKKLGDFELKAMYRQLQKYGWFAKFADSDALGGATNSGGFEAEAKIGLIENLALGIDFYSMKTLEKKYNSDTEVKETLVQFDLNYKF